MATTIVYPSIDVSGTASVSTIVSTAGTFAGSLTASTLAVTGTSTFSGTAVFLTTAQFLGTVTFSATVVFNNLSITTLGITGTASFAAQATFNATTTFSGTAVFLTSAAISGTASVGTLVVAGTSTFSGTAVFLTTAQFLGTVTHSATAVFVTTPLVNRGTGLYAPNSFLLATASGATSTQFKLTFSNTNGAFSVFRLYAQGKASGGTNFIVFFYSDGGTTPFMTYQLVANTTATASSGILLMDIVHDTAAAPLMVALPVFQHFKGVTTQATQTRSSTFTTSCINCIGVTMAAGATTKTMSAASIYITGFVGNK